MDIGAKPRGGWSAHRQLWLAEGAMCADNTTAQPTGKAPGLPRPSPRLTHYVRGNDWRSGMRGPRHSAGWASQSRHMLWVCKLTSDGHYAATTSPSSLRLVIGMTRDTVLTAGTSSQFRWTRRNNSPTNIAVNLRNRRSPGLCTLGCHLGMRAVGLPRARSANRLQGPICIGGLITGGLGLWLTHQYTGHI
jgi:hypothetical protein